ncbi:phosphate ABC transporter permease subunit PstC [candidate division WOR-3 bacterium]|nr:phosphate ABC transporter permease subunit PstC [candidate division WOR-3 bacterium]MCK4528201.1 phosphate ABC transporter permease subunit PstC [candidate division WOR-3 bacterium]
MKEKLFKYVTTLAALCSIIFLFGIIFSIFKEGYPIFREVGLFKFLGGKSWHPTHYPPDFGILSLIVGSIVVTIGALIVSIPLGVGSAIYIAELAHPRIKEILKPLVELLAGVPSVIYGLFGMAFLSPFIRELFDIPTGLNALTASIILGIMVVPIISSISEDAITSVPKDIREASYALGANKWETIIRVVLPSAKSGVIAGVVLGFGRAIGETMVVLMVSGGAAIIPKTILEPVRPMTSAIAAEMGETIMGSSHLHALFGIAIVLFIITLVLNMTTELVIKKRMTK